MAILYSPYSDLRDKLAVRDDELERLKTATQLVKTEATQR